MLLNAMYLIDVIVLANAEMYQEIMLITKLRLQLAFKKQILERTRAVIRLARPHGERA